MRITQKIAIVLIIPLILMMGYHFISVSNSFDRISDARAFVFLQSAEEVKYASQVQNYSSLIANKLFEISAYQRARDGEKLSNAVQLYRELQQQRYYSLRELQERIAMGGESSDQFLQNVDSNRSELMQAIARNIARLDTINERIIQRMGLQPGIGVAADGELDSLFLEAIAYSRELDQLMGEFIEQRYQKVTTTSEAVEVIEGEAESSLLFGVLLGYIVSGLMLLYIYYLVVRPMEKFAQLFAFDDPAKVQWTAFERARSDEFGQTLRGIESLYARLHSRKKTGELEKKSKRKKRKNA